MAVILPTPINANETHRVSLNGKLYSITYKYNTRDGRWRISLSDSEGVFISNVKVMENQLLLGLFNLSERIPGDILCIRVQTDGLPVGRSNLGIDRAYELIYLLPEEVESLRG